MTRGRRRRVAVPENAQRIIDSGLSATAVMCHTRSYGHGWIRPFEKGFRSTPTKVEGGIIKEVTETLPCRHKCGLVAVDRWELLPFDGKRRRIGNRTYEKDPDRPYYLSSKPDVDGKRPERMTNADWGYAAAMLLYPDLRQSPPAKARGKKAVG